MMFFKKDNIKSFDRINLRLSGMRGTEEYELVCMGEMTEVSHYRLIYEDMIEKRRLERRAECYTEMITELLNLCDVSSWDGFSGAHPRGVRDGIMMRFTAEVNDGKVINASGSENFPKKYKEFRNAVMDIFNKDSK